MKRVVIFSILAILATGIKAQKLSINQLRDSASHYYIEAMYCLANASRPIDEFKSLLDIYDSYRRQCLALLKTKKEQDDFLQYVVDAWNKEQNSSHK